jgi:hypothetical protein
MDKPTDKAILFDFDSVIYGAGFATESIVYTYDGKPLMDEKGEVSSEARARRVCEANELPLIVDEEVLLDFQVTPEPLENALHIVNTIYAGVEKGLQGYGKIHTLLSDSLTFRHHLATIKPYKGNRINSRKPYWYAAIREHVTQYRDAVYVEGLEADDLCGIFQREDTVIAGIDKDLLTIPGSHWNWKKKEFNYVSELEADRFFYTQMLSGDKADHIPGLGACSEETIDEYELHHSARRGCGDKSAIKILENAPSAAVMYERVRECYILAYEQQALQLGIDFDSRAEMGVLLDLQEIGRLLYMTREIREDCSPVLWELPTEKDRNALEVTN